MAEQEVEPVETDERDQVDELVARDRFIIVLRTIAIGASIAIAVVLAAGIAPGLPISPALLVHLLATASLTLGAAALVAIRRAAATRQLTGRRLDHHDPWANAATAAAYYVLTIMAVTEMIALAAFLGLASTASPVIVEAVRSFPVLAALPVLALAGMLAASWGRQIATGEALAGAEFRRKPRRLRQTAPFWIAGTAAIIIGELFALGILQGAGIGVRIDATKALYITALGPVLLLIGVVTHAPSLPLRARWRNAMLLASSPVPATQLQVRRGILSTFGLAAAYVALSGLAAWVVIRYEPSPRPLLLGLMAWFLLGGALASRIAVATGQEVALAKQKAEELRRARGEKPKWKRRRTLAEVARIGLFTLGATVAVGSLVVAFQTRAGNIALNAQFATDWVLLAVLAGAGPAGYFYNSHRRRREAIDGRWPVFLRDLAELARVGMTLPHALVTTGQGDYGELTKEIKRMAAQVQWGVPFDDALARFAERTKTPLIQRSVSLIVEAQRSGGDVVEILTSVSEDVREIQQILQERNVQMSTYNVVVYVAFLVFLGVIVVMSSQFIPAFKEAVDATGGQGFGGINFRIFEESTFINLFFHAALIQAIGGGLVGGVLTRGTPMAGFVHAGAMILIAWLVFRVFVGVL